VLRKDAARLAVLVAMLWFSFAPAAHAGSYTVSSCNAPSGGGTDLAWTVQPYSSIGRAAPDPASFVVPATGGACSATTGLTLTTSPSAAKAVKSNDGAAFVFQAPAGNVVNAVAIWRYGQARPSSSAAASPYWEVIARSGAEAAGSAQLGTTAGTDYCLGNTAWPAYCAVGTTPFAASNAAASYSGINQPFVAFGVECIGATQSQTCVTGDGSAFNAQFQFQGANVAVEDDTPPVVDAGSPTDGWHSPAGALTATGNDGGGLKQMGVTIDGHPVASAAYTCDFHLPSPCPTNPQLSVPLTGLSDGPHPLTVTGTDVVNNGGRADRVVDVDGTPPAVSLVPTQGSRTITFAVSDASSGVQGGQIAIRAKQTDPFTPLPTTLRRGRLLATVPKGKQPSDFGIHVTATDNAGNVTSGQATTMTLNTRLGKHAVKVRHASAAVPYKHVVAVTGRLTTVDGFRLGGQALTVTSTERVSGAKPQFFRTVTTSPTGRFGFSVPAGPSRRIDVTYAGGIDLLHRTRSVTLKVPASSTIHASRTTVFGAATVHFSGHLGLFGARLPKGGKIVVLEAAQHGRWSTVGSTTAHGHKGAWHADAHFRGNPGRFPVRLRIPREAVFPYDLGHSRAITVRVL
jgi:hypothetical protein